MQKFKHDQDLTYEDNEVMVASGAKHALYTSISGYTWMRDDEVIIPTPYWVSYPEQVKLAGGVPVYVEGQEEQ